MGKSAILSAWLAQRETASATVPHHFVRRQVADWDQPEVIAASLAAQVEAAFPALRDPDAKPERRLLELLGRVSQQLGPAGRLVVLVDGLDETRAEPGDNPLPRFLPHAVPACIRFLCATRLTYPHLGWLEARSPVRRLDLDDARWAASNEAVVRGFWRAVVSEYEPPLPAETAAAAVARADGNVLHAVMLHDALRDLPAPERRADRIPRGLKALVGEVWDRAASHESVRTGLGLLCAAQEALSLDVLADLADWTYPEKERFRCEARQLLLEEPAAWAGAEAYRPRHEWVRELIAERLGAATLRRHHATLARQLAIWPPPADPIRRTYAVCHALVHRIAIDDWTGVGKLASDLGYLEARAHDADVYVMEQELKDAAWRCPDREAARILVDLARALALDSHWIRNDPMGTVGLLWNRLRRAGWTAEELDARIALPVEVPFLRVRFTASRESAALVRTLDGHADSVAACAVTPDGRRVVSGSRDRTLKVWDLDAGRVLATFDGHAAGVNACAVTPDGRRVVSASRDHTLKIWDLDTGRILATLDGHTAGVTACAVTPDGRRAISASDDRTLKIWDLETARVLATLGGHAAGVNACAVTPDGRRVISASEDRTLKIWDLDTGRVLTTLSGHAAQVTACAVTPDGRRVISGSRDRSLKVWDLHTSHLVATFDRHTYGVTACAVTSDGRRAVSASDVGMLKIWDLDAGQIVATFDGHAGLVHACAVTPDGRRVISASIDDTLKVWELDADCAPATIHGHVGRVTGCAVTPDGRRAISAGRDGTLKLWDADQGVVLRTLADHGSRVTGCAMVPDGRRVISASRDRTLKVWDLHTGRVLATFRHAVWINACAVTPDGRRVVSATDDGALRSWDLDTGRHLATFDGHAARVNACAVTSDGHRVVSASDDGTLRSWDLDTGRHLATFEGRFARMNACAVTPDGRRVIAPSLPGMLTVWDLDTGRALASLEGHTDEVRGCTVTPDGRRVISASSDRTLKIWDLETARCLVTHRGDVPFQCVTTTTTAVIAGDLAGAVWFLEWPREAALSSDMRANPFRSAHRRRP